jgi:hypothetical protein
MPATPDSHSIVLDTLVKLLERGYGMFGTCLDCVRLYRMDVPAEQQVSSDFDIDLAKLVAERGAASSCIRMPPVPCPRCGRLNTECRITTPPYRR